MELAQLQPKLYPVFCRLLQSGKMSHAYLFSGDFASFEMALFLAKSQFCETPKNSLPCGKCRACHLIDEQEFSDVKVIEPSGQFIKTDIVREMLKEFSSSGFESDKQVFIIKDADKMHVNAANSLLKYIEEPQTDSYIILLTKDESKILPTIKSRTQIFRFPKQIDLLVRQAQEYGLLNSQSEVLAELANSPKDLETLLQQKKIIEIVDRCQSLRDKWSDFTSAYLEIARLSQFLGDKREQEMVFQILTILSSKKLGDEKAATYLQTLYEARMMWLSNVSFQNALEFMLLSYQ